MMWKEKHVKAYETLYPPKKKKTWFISFVVKVKTILGVKKLSLRTDPEIDWG